MALATAAEVRAAGLSTVSGTASDTLIDTLIARADDHLATYCGFPLADSAVVRTLESATYTLHVTPQEPRRLYLPIRPVTSITTAHDDPAWTWGAVDLVDSGDYTLRGPEGLILLSETASTSWSVGAEEAAKIVCVAGYSTVPEHVKQAAILYVRHLWRLRADQGLQSRGEGEASTSYRPERIPDAVKALLAPCVIVHAGLGYA